MTIFLSFLLGFLALKHVPRENGSDKHMLFLFSLPLGIGFSSLIIFYSLLLFKEHFVFYALLFHLVIISLLILFLPRHFLKNILMIKQINFKLKIRHYISILIISIFFLFSLVIFVKLPYGFWDSMAMWNLKAKIMLHRPMDWLSLFAYVEHSDYPLLLPLHILWSWGTIGSESTFIPIAVSFCFSCSILAILFVFVKRFSSYILGLLSVFCAISCYGFIETLNGQYADSLIACYFLIAGISFLIAIKNQRIGFAWLGGLSLGASCFTKNEGLLMLIVLYFVLVCFFLLSKKKKYIAKVLANSFLAALPFLITLFIFKNLVGASNDLISIERIRYLPRLIFDLERIKIILNYVRFELFGVHHWFLFFYCFLLSIIFNFANFFKGTIRILTFTIFLTALGYFFVYLITPMDLLWHLQSSLRRLISHLFPLLIILMFYCSFDDKQSFA